ncbi:MAG: 30S ribosomal protein S16 [Chlamydiota bacterium]
MALIIRLRQQGNRNRQTYRLVVMKKTAPRDGAYIDLLGWYNPALEQDVCIYEEKVARWLEQGAEISDKAKALVKRSSPAVLQELAQKKQAAKLRAKQRKKEKQIKEDA